MPDKHFSLSQILNRFKEIVDRQIAGRRFWLRAEIANINFHRSGHVYLELAETRNGQVVAQCSGVIWSANAKAIRSELKEDFLNVLKQGNEVLIEVELNFDIRYGLKVVVRDLDLGFLLGEIEKRKQATISQLRKEGVAEANAALDLPAVIQRIALVASSSTAGYEDFVQQLTQNEYGYSFELRHFPSSVQGEQASGEVATQLRSTGEEPFDAVVLIRGGGSKMDLDVFNAYEIARAIAECPHPVFTGIGHETDVSVADWIAHRSFKTPTAVASFLVSRAHDFEERVENTLLAVRESSRQILGDRKSELALVSEGLVYAATRFTQLERGELHALMNRVVQETKSLISEGLSGLQRGISTAGDLAVRRLESRWQSVRNQRELLGLYLHRIFNNAKNQLDKQAEQAPLYSPRQILGRGYVIPRFQGRLYKGSPLERDTPIELEFHKRTIRVGYINEK